MRAGRSTFLKNARVGIGRVAGGAAGSGRDSADVLEIDERLFTRLINHLADVAPQEGCGLVAFDGGRPVEVYPGTNVLASTTRYRMADDEVLRAVEDMDRRGWWLGAIYHSHPNSPAEPSTTDLREANWPDALMIIVSFMSGEPQVQAWRVAGLAFEPVEIVVQPEAHGTHWMERVRLRVRGLLEQARPSPQPQARPGWSALPNGRQRPAVASGSQGAVRAYPAPQPSAAVPARRAVVGILGGMGPLATADLYRKIIVATEAGSDQEHLPVVIWADPRVPDRTEALLAGGEDPTPWLVRGGRALSDMGADFIVMPCNTAHTFLERVQPEVSKPILSMIDAAVDVVVRTLPEVQTVGLLATSGTLASEVYQRALLARGLNAVVPEEETQQRNVMGAIKAVKAGDTSAATTALLVEAGAHLAERGAQALIAACTEIPVVLQQQHVALPLVDATDALALLAITTARHLDASAEAGSPEWDTSPVPRVEAGAS